MHIRVCGAAGEVTGSAYLVTTTRARVLVDCGMFQGSADNDQRNQLPRDLHPDNLDAVVLTHAHLDHSGRLPLLVRHGYGRPIYATPEPTRGAGSTRKWRPRIPAMAAGLTDHVWITRGLLGYRVSAAFLGHLSTIEHLFPTWDLVHHSN